MTNEELVRTACRVVWSEGDLSRVGEFYADDFVADYPMTDWGQGLDGLRALAGRQREAFPDYREEIEQLIDAGDRIVVVLRIRGTNTGPIGGLPATGKPFEIRDVTICTCRDGRIVRQEGLSDYLSAYAQLGVVELPTAP